MIKYINYILSDGNTIIDLECLDWAKRYTWHKCMDGYIRAKIDKDSSIAIHRLFTGCPNDKVVDHINGCRYDNRLENLRVTDYHLNLHNTAIRVDNKSGMKNVYWSKKRKSWCAEIQVNGGWVFIGEFLDLNQAADEVIKYRDFLGLIPKIPEEVGTGEIIDLVQDKHQKLPSDNTSGFRGVNWSKSSGKWQARIMYKNHRKYLGLFDTPVEAKNAIELKKVEIQNEMWHGGQGE